MPATPSKRDRWLALGLLLAVAGVAYLLLVHPWWTVPMREVGERIDNVRERDLRVRMQLQQAPQVRKALSEAEAQLAGRPGFLPEATAELASAGLSQRLENVVLQASPGNRSCAISNRSPLPPAPASGERFARVAVQVRLRCGTPELAAVLHALESGTPQLFVDNLNILAQRFPAGPGQPGGGGLDVAFDLAGYLRPAGEGVLPVLPAAEPIPVPANPAAAVEDAHAR
jgi:general secretion pathway protein M